MAHSAISRKQSNYIPSSPRRGCSLARSRRLRIRKVREILFPKHWQPIRNSFCPTNSLLRHVQSEKWQKAVDNTSQALKLDPMGTPQLWYYDALAKFQLGKSDEARESATRSLAIDPRHSVLNTEQLLAVILARKADYAGAILHLNNCLILPAAWPASRSREAADRATGTEGDSDEVSRTIGDGQCEGSITFNIWSAGTFCSV